MYKVSITQKRGADKGRRGEKGDLVPNSYYVEERQGQVKLRWASARLVCGQSVGIFGRLWWGRRRDGSDLHQPR